MQKTVRKTLQYLIWLGTVSLFGSAMVSGDQADFPAGSPLSASIRFQYAVYYLTEPTKEPLAVVRQWLENGHKDVRIVEDIPKAPGSMLVRSYILENVREEYRPPTVESLRYSGRGLSRGEAEALQGSGQALILDFAHPAGNALEALRMATELVALVVQETGGLAWDEETREVFSAAAWRERRLGAWKNTIPDASRHITIHAYKNGEYVRAITLGMAKFGLPDIVVGDFSWSNNKSMGNLINFFAQAMLEGASFERPGEYDLDLREIANPEARQRQVAATESNATVTARLSLKQGTGEEGDPRNRLIEITFEGYPGPDIHARQDSLLSSLFGWEDSVSPVVHNDELLAASRSAKAKLPELWDAFDAGLAPGEFILVEAPFETPDGGNEWMWVEVTRWRGDRIHGLLTNEPFYIPELHAGQEVTVDQQDVFDYIRRSPDGSSEGNETGKIIQRMNQQ